MFGFLLGVIVGAGGYWAYRFWKGEDDTSWDTFSTGVPSASTYTSPSTEPPGTGTTGSPTGTGTGTGTPTTP